MKEATQKEIKEYLKNSRTRQNLYCDYCLNLKHGHIMGVKIKCMMIKPYKKDNKFYGWALFCPRCENRETLGY